MMRLEQEQQPENLAYYAYIISCLIYRIFKGERGE